MSHVVDDDWDGVPETPWVPRVGVSDLSGSIDFDLYKVLEIPHNAHADDIKKAYRLQLLKVHPDKNPDAKPDDFRRVQHAFETLSNAELRANYDSTWAPEQSMLEQIEGDDMFKAYVQLKKYAKSMDIFNRLGALETEHGIPKGTLRFKEGEECQGVGCGPFVDLSETTTPRRRAFLCKCHASIHECGPECSGGGRVCEVFAHVMAQKWRDLQRERWTVHPSKSVPGRNFYCDKQTGKTFWSTPPGLADPPWYGLSDTRHSKSSSASGTVWGTSVGDKSEEIRAEAHNCVSCRCNQSKNGGYVRVRGEEYLWICRASGLPHICTIHQCNLIQFSANRRCVVSGNNYNLGSESDLAAMAGSIDVERNLSEYVGTGTDDISSNYGIGTQGRARTRYTGSMLHASLENGGSSFEDSNGIRGATRGRITSTGALTKPAPEKITLGDFSLDADIDDDVDADNGDGADTANKDGKAKGKARRGDTRTAHVIV